MDDEAYEIHARLARQTTATIATHPGIGKAGLQKSGRVMVPQLGTHDQAVEVRPGQNAKVPKANVAAGEQSMQQRVATVHKPEGQALKPATALGKDRGWMPRIAHGLQEPGNVLGPVLPIGIHHHDRVALPVLLEVSKPDRQRPLMTQVAAQGQYRDMIDSCESERKFAWVARERTAVVNEEHAGAQRILPAEDHVDIATEL